MRRTVRHSSISQQPEVSGNQSGENARDVNRILESKITGWVREVNGYAATADVTAKINIAWEPGRKRPRMVLMGNCYPTDDAAASVQASTFRNFYFSPGSLGVYEPSGLVLNKIYNMTFLIVE